MSYEVTFTEKPRGYTVDGVEVPSVTTILGVLDKSGPLMWWAQGIGVKAVCDMYKAGEELTWEDPDGIVSLLVAQKRSVNHVRDEAATRGTSIHDAAQAYVEQERVPNPADYPVEDRGFIQALMRAFLALNPQPVAQEVIVGSKVHGFAGRFDMHALVDGRSVLIDFKTGRHIYPETQFPQLEAYRHAYYEQHDKVTEAGLVVRLDASGEFEVAESCATFSDFLAIKGAYESRARVREAVSARKRAEKAALKAAA